MSLFRKRATRFLLSEEDFIVGNYRTFDAIEAGLQPITTDASEIIKVHAEVVGKIRGRDKLVTSAINDKVGGFVNGKDIPAGYIPFGNIKRGGKLFVLRTSVAKDLKDIEDEVRGLSDKDYFTRKFYKKP